MSLNVPPVRKRRAEGGGVEDDPFERAAARTRQSVIRDRADQPASLSLPEKVAEGTLRGVDHMVGYPSRLMGAAMGGHPETAGDPYEWGAGTALNMVGTGAALPKQPNTLGTSGSPPIRAYHGSPHDFDKFDMTKIGAGEGAQAYGHGLYFAEKEGVAKSYRDTLSGLQLTNPATGKTITNGQAAQMVKRRMVAEGADPKLADMFANEASFRSVSAPATDGGWMKHWTEQTTGRAWSPEDQALWEKAHAVWGEFPRNKGRMYEVGIHADPAKFLDWDKPWAAQAPEIREIARESGVHPETNGIMGTKGPISNLSMGELAGERLKHPGSLLNRNLKDAEVPGIKYLDQGSRTAGDGSRNFVVFDDKLIDILRKYGIAGVAPAAGFAEAVRNGKTDEAGESHMRRGYAEGGDVKTFGAPVGAPPPSSSAYPPQNMPPTSPQVMGSGLAGGFFGGAAAPPAYSDPRHPAAPADSAAFDPRHGLYGAPPTTVQQQGLGVAQAQADQPIFTTVQRPPPTEGLGVTQAQAAAPISTFEQPPPSTAGFQGYGVRAHGGRIGRDLGGSLPVPGFAQRMASRGIDHAISNTSGALRSPIPGRTDKLPIDAPAGSYVLPSDVVSGMPGAEGNSEAGHRIMENAFTTGPFGMKLGKGGGKSPKFPRGMSMPKARAPRVKSFKGFDDGGAVAESEPETVPIIAAGGEFILTPDQVAEIGDGDIDAGHAILDEFVKQVRRTNIKTLQSLPGPAKK